MERQRYFSMNIRLADLDAGTRTANTTQLADIVQKTFLLTMAEGVAPKDQVTLNALGQKLRGQLRELLGEIFDAGTEALQAANENIRKVNAQIDQAIQDIAHIADTMEGLAKLAGALDKLLAVIGIFL